MEAQPDPERAVGRRYLAFDIETAKVLPEHVTDLLARHLPALIRKLGVLLKQAFGLVTILLGVLFLIVGIGQRWVMPDRSFHPLFLLSGSLRHRRLASDRVRDGDPRRLLLRRARAHCAIPRPSRVAGRSEEAPDVRGRGLNDASRSLSHA
jgi:hypothetical protein